MQRLRGQRFRADGARRRCHHVSGTARQQVRPHRAAQIAIRDDPAQASIGVDHPEAAELFFRNQQQGLMHRHIGRCQRHGIARVHQVAHTFQSGAELAAGMELAEIRRREPASGQQRNGQGIA